MKTPWPHQSRAVVEVPQAIADGKRRIILTSPTGGGKTDMMLWISDSFIAERKNVTIYTHRKMLIEQLYREVSKFGLDATVRAPGYNHEYFPLQIASIQTAGSRVIKRQTENLHKSDLVIFDEAHVMTGPTCQKVMKAHLDDGATILGPTATPLDLEGLYDHLIVAGTNSELRKCGAIVPALHYGPDEPDLRAFSKELATGKDLSESKAEKAMMTQGIFGRVVEWYKRLNPEQKPTILFAPSVGASLWFAQQFHAAGISAGHIDGEEVWINGGFIGGDGRNKLSTGSQDRSIRVVCNRFVLREGVNWPWLAHGILATVFGSLQSYLQSSGRLLRAYPGLDHVTIQDHGGNWWRSGSVNADRHWTLDLTCSSVAQLRADALRTKKEQEPRRCPKCGQIIQTKICPCGFEVHTRVRPVVQSDGTLKEMHGDIYKPRREAKFPTAEQEWVRQYFRARSSKKKMTFFQAEAVFAMEHNWQWPSRQWRMMPMNEFDMHRRVVEVDQSRLRL
jgi:superfamily II DNA or RNA helicase